MWGGGGGGGGGCNFSSDTYLSASSITNKSMIKWMIDTCL